MAEAMEAVAEKKKRARKQSEFVLQTESESGDWTDVAEAEITETGDGRKYVRSKELAGNFRVIRVTDGFSAAKETKTAIRLT